MDIHLLAPSEQNKEISPTDIILTGQEESVHLEMHEQ